MKTFNEWLDEGRKVVNAHYAQIARVKCADGYSVSIQASSGHYCSPRLTLSSVSDYESFELGFPTVGDSELIEYAENTEDLTDTVYGYVPREVIESVISKHGGIVGFFEPEAA